MERCKDFCDRVLSGMPRATKREKEDIRAELLDHLLEHKDVLTGYGVDEAEAERQAVAAMGDAEQIGKAWNERFSPFWLWFGRICMVCCVWLVLEFGSLALYRLEGAWNSIQIRNTQNVDAYVEEVSGFETFWEEDPGITGEFGQHMVRIYKVRLLQAEQEPEEYRMQLYVLSYPKDPFDYPMENNVLMGGLSGMYERSGKTILPKGGGGVGDNSDGYTASWYTFIVEKGLECVDYVIEYHGKTFEAEVELDWGGVDA